MYVKIMQKIKEKGEAGSEHRGPGPTRGHNRLSLPISINLPPPLKPSALLSFPDATGKFENSYCSLRSSLKPA